MRSTIRASLLVLTIWYSSSWAQSPGPWQTSGNTIIDSGGQPVRIAGVNWYGFETSDEVVHGLWAQDYKSILNTIKANGYNTIRLPFSNEMVESPIVPSNIGFSNGGGAINTDLHGLTSLQIFDKVVAYCGQIGLHVILDNHRSEAGNSAESNGLWYTGLYPESAWLNDWTTLASRYRNSPAVVGADLRNEPHNATSGGACWGCGSATNDWRLAAERGGNAILNVNPGWLIFVEGTDCYNGDCDWWGGNLEGAQAYPVILNVANRLVYSAHDYGPTEYGQSWFNSNTTYNSLAAVWTKSWAYLSLNGTAPVWLGEFGTTNNSADIQSSAAGSEGQWFQSLVSFLHSNSALSWTYWALNGEDNYGLLDSNYDATPANAQKQQALASIQASSGGQPACQTAPSTPSGVSAKAASASQINVTWTAISVPAGCSVTYNVYMGQNAGFTPSASNQAASALSTTSYTASGLSASTTYYFVISALDAKGTSGYSNGASATTNAGTTQAPSAPGSLAATAISASQINLSWPASSTSGVSYNLYRSQTSGFAASTSTVIASGISGTTYLKQRTGCFDDLLLSGHSNEREWPIKPQSAGKRHHPC